MKRSCYNRETMNTFLTDVHTHTTFSPDGKGEMQEMLRCAFEKGVAFYGVSEHVDYDMQVRGETAYEKPRFTDEEAYFHCGRHEQERYEGVMNVLIGAELGFADDEVAENQYIAFSEKYRPDCIINSIHTLRGRDYCRGVPYREADGVTVRDKREVYEEYFALVMRSLEVRYHYDIVGHVGYCTRYAPYEEKGASYREFSKEWDGVLKGIIERDKILEINTSNKLGVSPTLPDRDILERYFELGGRKVSYASDAHFKERILDKRELVVEMLKEIGFEYVTVPMRGEHIKVRI